MSVGSRIRERRKALGLNQEQLRDSLGYKYNSAISKIEKGQVSVNTESLPKIAEVLKTSTAYLIGLTDDPETPQSEIFNDSGNNNFTMSTKLSKSIPILGKVSAGNGCYADNNVVGYETIPIAWTGLEDNYVMLKVTGDSMLPLFLENDLLLIKPQPVCENGDYAVVLIDNENGVVKKVNYCDEYIELISENPYYPARRFAGQDMNRLRIFGVVKKCIRNF